MKQSGLMATLTSWVLAFARRPMVIRVGPQFGQLPNDREQAEGFASRRIIPALRRQREVVLDFSGVGLATQSFFHALLDDAIALDPRWATRIRLSNASRPQLAVFELAMRHMVETATSGTRTLPKLSPELVRR